MVHMRISSTEPSSVILSQTMTNKSLSGNRRYVFMESMEFTCSSIPPITQTTLRITYYIIFVLTILNPCTYFEREEN